MKVVSRSELSEVRLPGRIVWKAVGRDGSVASESMTVGFARYSSESGPMSPHRHAEESIYVVDSDRSWVRSGPDLGSLDERVDLERGMLLHFDELEWHVFEYGAGGHLDILFIYGEVGNIRPEEAPRK